MSTLCFGSSHLVIYYVGLCLIINATTGNASGMFELRLDRFVNDEGKQRNGNCCLNDGSRVQTKQCQHPCRTAFRICLTHYQATVDTKRPCTFGDTRTPIIGENTFEPQKTTYFQQHPIQFNFTLRWPGTFTLIVDILHVKANGEKTPVLASRDSNLIISRLIKRGTALPVSSVDGNWTRPIPHRYSDTELQYSYRVRCQPHQYGDGCNIYCRPRDDMFGHFTCDENGGKVCLPGWTGISKRKICAEPICKEGCHPEHGACERPNECNCEIGWNGTLCDKCAVLPGCKNGKCINAFECNCTPGWGGLFCNQDLNYCTNHRPCQNGALCSNTGQGSYTCECKPGFYGKDCESETNECLSSPCTNGTHCVDLINDYQCICPNGFYGSNCDEALTCYDKPCKNGGLCRNIAGSYDCQCLDGWMGDQCELVYTGCTRDKCRNGGKCKSTNSGFKCQCPSGFRGRLCQEEINDCSVSPCFNSGTCYNLPKGGFVCQCTPGYVGKQCEDNSNDCSEQSCNNAGICIDLTDDFRCICASGFTGKDCGNTLNNCPVPSPCLNGGQCVDGHNQYFCKCPNGFRGDHCQMVYPKEGADDIQPPRIRHDLTKSPQNRIIIMSNQPNNLTTTQWIAICLGAGILVLILIFAATCLLYHRKRNPILSTPNNPDQFGSDSTTHHMLPDIQICETSEKTSKSNNIPTCFSKYDVYNCKVDDRQERNVTQVGMAVQHNKNALVTDSEEDHLVLNGDGSGVQSPISCRPKSIQLERVIPQRLSRVDVSDKTSNRLPTYEEACKENDALLKQCHTNNRKELSSPLSQPNSNES